MISCISVESVFYTHLETTSAALHITLPQMPAQVVSQHCKHCNKLGRLARRWEEEGWRCFSLPNSAPPNTHHSTAWDSWLGNSFSTGAEVNPQTAAQTAASTGAVAPTGILCCSQARKCWCSREQRGREFSLPISSSAHYTEGLQMQPHNAAVGEEPCPRPVTNPWVWWLHCWPGTSPAVPVDPASVGTFPGGKDAKDSLGTGALLGTSLGALLIWLWVFSSLLPPNFRQCWQWDQT